MEINTYSKAKITPEFVLNIKKEDIQDIDYSPYSTYINHAGDHRRYILEGLPGLEHYRLLSYLSIQFSNMLILDIGSFRALSAIALSYNQSNKVYSFDLYPHMLYDLLFTDLTNIEFKISNILNTQYDSLLLASSLILLDTAHLGDFELEFHNKLVQLNYSGLVLYDDINLNQEMKNFWNKVDAPKFDISHIGHASGTGAVFYNIS